MAASSPAPNLADEFELGCAEDNEGPHSPLLYQLAGLHQGCPTECSGPSSFEKLMKPINQMIEKKTYRAHFSAAPQAAHLAPPITLPMLDCKCDHIFETNTHQWCLPLRRRADVLVTLYFGRNHSVFPILHEETFRRQYARIWEAAPKTSGASSFCSGLCKQKSQGRLFPATLYAIFAGVSVFESAQLEQNATRADAFFREAQKVDLLEILDNEVGIELVQLLLLMGRYLQSTERFSKCKNISGLAIRLAQNMGLQYSTSEARARGLIPSSCNQLECEMRARVWQGCVMLEREMALSFGRSPVGATISRRFQLPQAIDDKNISEQVGKINTQPADAPSVLEVYIQIIRLYDIPGPLLDQDEVGPENAPDDGPHIDLLLKLDTVIIKWRDDLPQYLRYDPSDDQNSREKSVFPQSEPCMQQPSMLNHGRKIYARFLYIRQLILRPALEAFFKKQQNNQGFHNRMSGDTGLEDLMLGRIAAECVMSAVTLVETLNAHIKMHDFMAWWLNVSFLHTSGSTLLMGRLCTFNDASFSAESLLETWNMCLKNLARYDGLSSIAKKSCYVLNLSAKRLIPGQTMNVLSHGEPGIQQEETDFPQPNRVQGMQQSTEQVNPASVLRVAESHGAPMTEALARQSDNDGPSLELTVALDESLPLLDSDLVFDHLPDIDDEFSSGDLGTLNWPFLPFLSQLEAMSPPLDF
ncbi:uncharacterized protein A1O9_10479 [Exophiala aquamarina CBS 119918]|uniref:Xylanolytic transcriptional activator regulatory domain-containing protein n=1 Tax=Exophiala aquamarina CBS 119918 TaxID=1182545 RepID=A0A072P054_9EURO|nr:uncharacterized protein A1O9_10479 [Exophiala aquamarina CBS 119918]KEF53504.1 hypothetical protein A1O9_10479 [Exophiala aquamarina CBS 119918]